MSPQFSADSARQPEIAGVSDHILSDCGDRQGGNTVACSDIHHPGHVDDRFFFMLPADKHLHGHCADIKADGLFDIDSDILIGKLLEDAGPAGDSQHNRFCGRRRDHASQDAAGQHQRIRVRQQGRNIDINPFQTGGRPLEISMVDCQHDRTAGVWVKNTRQPVFHPPVQRVRSFQKKPLGLLRLFQVILFSFGNLIHIRHDCFSFLIQ